MNRLESAGKLLGLMILTALAFAFSLAGYDRPVKAAIPVGQAFACGADNIGATLTILSASPNGNCVGTSDGFSRYITDIVAVSTTATGGEYILRTGTGANCGTNTVTLFPFAASGNVRMSYPGNTAAPAVIQFKTPVQVPEARDLCVIGTATNTVTIEVRGFIGTK